MNLSSNRTDWDRNPLARSTAAQQLSDSHGQQHAALLKCWFGLADNWQWLMCPRSRQHGLALLMKPSSWSLPTKTSSWHGKRVRPVLPWSKLTCEILWKSALPMMPCQAQLLASFWVVVESLRTDRCQPWTPRFVATICSYFSIRWLGNSE